MTSLTHAGAVQKAGRQVAQARRSRLALARHHKSTNALGWVLLGFVLGVGAAIAVMMHADLGGTIPPGASAPGPVPAARPHQAPPTMQAAKPPPQKMQAADLPVSAPPAIPPHASAARPADSEDPLDANAAAAGLTSHIRDETLDLY